MLIDDIKSWPIYKTSATIKTELKFLKSEIKTIREFGCWYRSISQYIEGLNFLKDRWQEYKSKMDPSKITIRINERNLQKCDKKIEKLKILSLTQTPKIQKSKITLSGNREDISLFKTQEQKQAAIQIALEKLEKCTVNRNIWIEKNSNSLSLCHCQASKDFRAEHEKEFLKKIIKKYPPHPSFELSLMSLGSGGLMQDWLLLQQLDQTGYQKIYLHLVDPMTTEEMVDSLKHLIATHLKNLITVVHSQACLDPNIEECRPFHAIHALDFDSVLYSPGQPGAWRSLVIASDCLKEHGFLFCSAYGKKYWFNAKKRNWKLPINHRIQLTVDREKENSSLVCCISNIKQFWNDALYNLAELAKTKKNIKIEIISSNRGYMSLISSCDTVKKILAPNSEMELYFEPPTENKENIYDVFWGPGRSQLIDKKFLDVFVPKMKINGIMILNSRQGYQSDDIRESTKLKEEYDSTVESIKNYAETLALSHSVKIIID